MEYTIQTNIYSIIVLLIIIIGLRRHRDAHHLGNRIFRAIIIIDIILMIIDVLIQFTGGVSGTFALIFHYFLHISSFSIAPLIGLLWFYFVNVFTKKKSIPLKPWHIVFLLPLILNMVLAFISIFGSSIFYLDENNIYTRGRFFLIYVVISYFYLVISIIVIILQRKNMRKSNFVPLLLFSIPPIIGGIIQTLFYGLLITWQSIAISCLMIFLFVQSEIVVTDYLTGLFNKREFDEFLNQIKRSKYRHIKIAGMMIDLDNFKQINDQFGHVTGDQILREMGEILRKSFRKNDFLARVGGDEFAIFFEISQKEDENMFVQRLLSNINQFNLEHTYPFDLSISFGIDTFDSKSNLSIQEFFSHLDKLLYEQKNIKQSKISH